MTAWRHTSGVALICVTLTGVSNAGAQGTASVPSLSMSPARAEVRVGVRVPPDEIEGNRTLQVLGALAAVPVGDTGTWSRATAQFAIDYEEFSHVIFVDPVFGRALSADYQLLLSPRLGITAVRTARLVADANVGWAFRIRRSTLSLERTPDADGVPGTGLAAAARAEDFRNVCDLAVVADRCRYRYKGLVTMGAGIRWLRTANGTLFFGADYSWHSDRRHQIVGTVGVMSH